MIHAFINHPRTFARVQVAWLIGVPVAAALVAVAGCNKKESQAADQGRARAASEHGEGDGHGHGEESEHGDEVVLTPDAIGRYGIKTERAQLWRLRPTFMAPGRIAFNTEALAHVGSPLPGRAVEIKARIGASVKAGDELFLVESPDLGEAQSDFFLKKTAAETAQPAVQLARMAWDRARGLYEKSEGIALTEVQKREAEYKAAVAASRSADAAAVAAENRLHLLGMKSDEVKSLAGSGEVQPRLSIRAPIDGQVIAREVTLGELVSPDRESLMTIADTSVFWVLANVPEARVPEVVVGTPAWVTMGGAEAKRFEGSIALISPSVDTMTRTAQIRIEIRNDADAGQAMKPGMFAQVEIVATDPSVAEPPAMVAVPEQAVQTVEGAASIFVPVSGEQNTFARRAVTIGKVTNGLVPVYAGLAEGELFVMSGTFILKAELGKAGAEHAH